MNAAPTTTVPTTSDDVVRRYVEDVFMRVRHCSRKLDPELCDEALTVNASIANDELNENETAVSELLAATALQAVAFAEHLTAALHTYTQAIYDLAAGRHRQARPTHVQGRRPRGRLHGRRGAQPPRLVASLARLGLSI
ncbi:MAG: hypothetical protein AABM40_10665 [Chloroflexota bacterium]